MDLGSDAKHVGGKRDFQDQEDNFKPVFKRYKNRTHGLDLSEVVDFRLPDVCKKFEVTKREIKTGGDICSCFGLKPPKKWQSYTLNSTPGFIFVSNPFKVGHQRYWLKRLLEDIPNPTNKSNLSDGFPVNGESVWDLHCKRYPSGKKSAFSQLRWVTLGYHYNWSTKLYDPEDVSPFPEDIGILSAIVATSLGFHNFKAEAAIVNYYNMNSTLGGHNDHSELDHDAPLISFSFGQSAIFLVGGTTKAAKPTPILLRSGDVIILSSSSRLAFHGVPRILHDNPENLKLCWGMTEEVDRRNENIPSVRERDGQEDTEILNKQKINEACKVRTGCNIEGNDDNLTSREKREESEIILTDGKMFNDRLPCTTVEESNIERNDLQSRLCRSQKGNCSDDESHQIVKVREVSDLAESPNRTEQRKEKLEVTEGDEAMRINCTERQETEQRQSQGWRDVDGKDKETLINSSQEPSQIDSKITDFSSLWNKFPHIDDILKKISTETDRMSQNTLWEPFEKHLQNARLNVSVRQVNTSI